MTGIARVNKHAATNDNSLDLDLFNRKLALVGIIPNQNLFSFSSDKDRRPWVRFPAGLRCVFSSDPAVSSSIFVGAEREENLFEHKKYFKASRQTKHRTCKVMRKKSDRAMKGVN